MSKVVGPRGRGWLSGAIGVLLVAGCLPAPNKATMPGQLGQENILRPNLPAGLSAGQVPVTAAGQVPLVVAPIVAAPIISNNGSTAIQGTVRAPATIISHNGGNIISNNGGSIISNNGANIISHNGGNIVANNSGSLQIAQVPLAYTTVRVKDAAGNPVKDIEGRDLVTKTDDKGNYAFPVEVKGRNLVIEAEVEGQQEPLKSLLPKEGLEAGKGLDVDLVSSLTMTYILDQYVKGDLATFEKLPKDVEAKARTVTEGAFVRGAIELPKSLEQREMVAKVDEVRKADQAVDQVFEEIKRLLVVVGVVNAGDGMKATDVIVSGLAGVVADEVGNVYTFSQAQHTLWKVTPDGVLHTLVAYGNWGYPEQEVGPLQPGYTTGITLDAQGNIFLSDTYNNRIVRVGPDNRVTVIAGTGVAGFSGDKGPAVWAQLNHPSGLARDAAGNIWVSDTESHRVRKIRVDGVIETVGGTGVAGFSGDGGEAREAQLNQPQGLAIGAAGKILIADYGNDRIREIDIKKGISTHIGGKGEFRYPISIFADEAGNLLGLSDWGGKLFKVEKGEFSLLDISSIRSGSDTLSGRLLFPKSVYRDKNKMFIVVNDGSVFSVQDESLTHLLGAQKFGENRLSILMGASSIDVDSDKNVYVADTEGRKIIKVSPENAWEVVAGNGNSGFTLSSKNAKEVPIGKPIGLCLSKKSGLIFTTMGAHPLVQKIGANGELSTIAGDGRFDLLNPPNGIALKVPLANPFEVVELADGRIYALEPQFFRLIEISDEGTIRSLSASNGWGFPYKLVKNKVGELVYLEWNEKEIRRFRDNKFEIIATLPRDIDWAKNDVKGLVLDDSGNVFVADRKCVYLIKRDGAFVIVAGEKGLFLNKSTIDEGLLAIGDIDLSLDGDLYILDDAQVKRISKDKLEVL